MTPCSTSRRPSNGGSTTTPSSPPPRDCASSIPTARRSPSAPSSSPPRARSRRTTRPPTASPPSHATSTRAPGADRPAARPPATLGSLSAPRPDSPRSSPTSTPSPARPASRSTRRLTTRRFPSSSLSTTRRLTSSGRSGRSRHKPSPTSKVIVVDDGSTDGGGRLITGLDDPRFRLIVQENGGPGRARNRGLSAASGTFVTFLDADDEWLPEFLRTSIGLMERHGPDVAAVCQGYFEISVRSIEGTALAAPRSGPGPLPARPRDPRSSSRFLAGLHVALVYGPAH
jgi:hypothetical protein